jgi:hypothetical protein
MVDVIRHTLIALLIVTGRAAAQGAPWVVWPPAGERCRPASGDARAIVERVRRGLGGDNVLRVETREIVTHNYESDRPYRPFLTFATDHISWLDPATGVERDSSAGTVTLGDDRTTFVRRDTAWQESDDAWTAAQSYRSLDPWVVVRAWAAAGDVRVSARCLYRDYDRVVLTRKGVYGDERLYIDPKSDVVIKLDRVEPHYLWGQQHVEYVYTTWWLYGGVLQPTVATRLVDGDEEVARSLVSAAPVGRDAAPALALPPGARADTVSLPRFLLPAPLDTVRLGPRTFVLANRGFNEIVTLQRDTVYLLDATQSETRARADSAWISRLFPGPHPVVLIVTDLAWPHVAGVRFWVARGATVVSHRLSEPFLRAVVARRWTAHPDALELARPRPTLRFVPATESLDRAGPRVYPIDGVASEGALMVYLPEDGVLWASDYVQQLNAPARYTTEVHAAACRAGITPSRVVAEHQPLAPWSAVTALVAGGCG